MLEKRIYRFSSNLSKPVYNYVNKTITFFSLWASTNLNYPILSHETFIFTKKFVVKRLFLVNCIWQHCEIVNICSLYIMYGSTKTNIGMLNQFGNVINETSSILKNSLGYYLNLGFSRWIFCWNYAYVIYLTYFRWRIAVLC